MAYNQRLAAGAAVFDRRADNLLATVDRFAADLGSASATIDQHLSESGGPLVDFVVDDIFYRTKGRLYAYFLLLKALGEDFAPVLKERQVATVYGQMLTSLAAAARLDPLIVVGGTPDGLYFPNHLAVQGFYLLRARAPNCVRSPISCRNRRLGRHRADEVQFLAELRQLADVLRKVINRVL